MEMKALVLSLVCAVTAHAGDLTVAKPFYDRPFEISIKRDIPLLSAGIAAAGAAFVLERSLKPLTQEEINGLSRTSINSFDRTATYRYSKTIDNFSDILVDCVLAAPLTLLTDRKVRASVYSFSVMYTEAVALAYALPSLGKGFFERPRPFVYNGAVPADEKLTREARVSFFSRHTTFSFASATFISSVYGSFNPGSKLTPYLWTGSLAAASAVGFARFAAGAHFPTDILTGALAGGLIGWGVPYLHRSKNSAVRFSIDPVGNSFSLSCNLQSR